MSNLPFDARGKTLQVFSPYTVMTAVTNLDTSNPAMKALLPTAATRVKINGSSTFVDWPSGVTFGLVNITSLEFESATDLFVM